MKLRDIAKVNTGLVVSRSAKDKDKEETEIQYKYFTLSSIEHNQKVDKTKLKEITVFGFIGEKFLSKKSDIIIGLSAPHSLAYIDDDFQGIIIPSQFAVIRVINNEIIPEYLIAYLASDEIKSRIANTAKGSEWIKRIDLSGLLDLLIEIPSLQKQKQIIQLNTLVKEENALNYQYAKLVEKKNNYYLNMLIVNKGEKI